MALKFILIKDRTGYDISDIVQKVTWSGRKNSPARSLQLVLLDDASLGSANRADIDVYSGNHVIFVEDGTELFRGIIMKQMQTQEHTLTVTAYDNAIYLSNNRDSFSYKKKTLTDVFLDVCTKYGISRGETAVVQYKIPVLADNATTIYDILCNALSQTYKATGERYYIMSKKGQLHLLRRKEQVTKYVLETGASGSSYGNLTQYSYSRDISNTRTRLKLVSQEGKVMAQWADMDLEDKIGMMQDVQTPDDEVAKGSLKTLAVTMLNELKKPAESLNITVLGISSVYSGTAVYISIPDIGIGRTFYVDADTHIWDGDYHTMKLTLNFAKDLESINEAGETETDKSADSSATKNAKQAIKDAASALKKKKAAESKVIKAGKAAEKAAVAAEKALANAKKAKNKSKATAYANTVITQSAKAQAENGKAKTALAEAKALMNMAQSSVTTSADYAAGQAESAAKRAATAAAGAADYL
jgi:hypothetical protein